MLRTKLIKNNDNFTLSQSHYVESMLKKFVYFDCKLVSTPYDPSLHLVKNEGDSVSQIEYACIIGSLMDFMNCTRPDIAYAINRLSRYTYNLSDIYWIALNRIMRDLKGTMKYGLIYSGYPSVLEGYSDANWISNFDELKSTSGYVFMLASRAICWKSTKQTCIARSTMESEFIALKKAGTKAKWLRNLMVDIPLWTRIKTFVSIHCDCQVVVARAKSKIYNGKSQLNDNNVISMDFVRPEKNLADLLMKPLARMLVKHRRG